jgi:hypothetical protein
VLRRALDVGIELGHREAAVDDVALQLGEVDPVGGEAAERLLHGSARGTPRKRRPLGRVDGIARQHPHARSVVLRNLDADARPRSYCPPL